VNGLDSRAKSLYGLGIRGKSRYPAVWDFGSVI